MSRPKVAPADQAAAKLAENARRVAGGALVGGGPKQAQLIIPIHGEPTRFELVGVHVFTDEAMQVLANLIAGNVANVVQALVPKIVDEVVKTRLEEAGLVPTPDKLTTHEMARA